MKTFPKPANNDNPLAPPSAATGPQILNWLNRFTYPGVALETLHQSPDRTAKAPVSMSADMPPLDDWQMVQNLCGYGAADFEMADAPLPLTAAEVDYFRRNHRGVENHVYRDFLISRSALPSPLAELYGLYLHRARVDAEAALFLAQATTSTRVARTIADLLAIGGFANGMEFITHLTQTYSVPAAFDTSSVIDHANMEAMRRLALPADHPSHLMKLLPDELGDLAATLADAYALSAEDFLEKANKLAEARQDVNRLPTATQFATAVIEGDLPSDLGWVMRLSAAYGRVFENWVKELDELHLTPVQVLQ